MEKEFNLNDLNQYVQIKWRIQSHSKTYNSATCIPYIDARSVMSLLDEIAGPENWQSDYKEIKGNLYAGIGIKINNEWVWKWDCGTESNTEKAKGEASDSFKRAGVKWGIGRFLYHIPVQYVKTNELKTAKNYPYPIDDNGDKIRDLSSYLNDGRSEDTSFLPLKTTDKKVNSLIISIDKCKNLDELRKIREANNNLELTNSKYKKALAKKYELLNSHEKGV